MRFFNEIAESNTPRVVVFSKNSYQTFVARNELEHADRRIHEFVRQVHSQFIENAPSLSIKPLQRMHAVAVPYSGSSLSRIRSANGASLCVLLPEGRSSLRYRDLRRSSLLQRLAWRARSRARPR